MLELIDQSNPVALRYRCSHCGVEGVSTVERSGSFLPMLATQEGFFWTATPGNPQGRWTLHVCGAPLPATPMATAEPKRRRGRPKKVDSPAV